MHGMAAMIDAPAKVFQTGFQCMHRVQSVCFVSVDRTAGPLTTGRYVYVYMRMHVVLNAGVQSKCYVGLERARHPSSFSTARIASAALQLMSGARPGTSFGSDCSRESRNKTVRPQPVVCADELGSN